MSTEYLDLSKWVPCTAEDFDSMAAMCDEDEIRKKSGSNNDETALFLNGLKIAVTLVDNAGFRRFYVKV